MKRMLLVLLFAGAATSAWSQPPGERPLPATDTPVSPVSDLRLPPVWENVPKTDPLPPVWFDPSSGRDIPASMERFMERRGLKLESLPKLELFHYKALGGSVGFSNGQAQNWGSFPNAYLDARTLSFPHSGRGGGRRR